MFTDVCLVAPYHWKHESEKIVIHIKTCLIKVNTYSSFCFICITEAQSSKGLFFAPAGYYYAQTE